MSAADVDPQDLLQIGVFSRLARVSVRMLRHYAEHGLLVPAGTDPYTGYRYYRPSQLTVAEQIVRLRDAGFTVAEMVALRAGSADHATLSVALTRQRAQLLRQQDVLNDRLAALDRLINELQETPMTFDVRLTTLPAMTIAAVRDVIDSYAAEYRLWERLMPPLMSGGHVLLGLSGATFYDEDYQDTDTDVEAWTQVATAFAATAPVTCRQVPEQQVLMTTLHGSYDGMAAATAALGAEVAARGVQVGPMFNIYTVGPAQDPNPDNWVTEVCLPIVEG